MAVRLLWHSKKPGFARRCESATTWEVWWYASTPSQVLSRNQHTFRIHSTTVPALCLFAPDGSTTGEAEFYTALACSDADRTDVPGFVFGIRGNDAGGNDWQKPASCA